MLCKSFQDPQTDGMESTMAGQGPPTKPLARHLSEADRLRKVIQELLDTEKTYVKVSLALYLEGGEETVLWVGTGYGGDWTPDNARE